MSISNRDLRQRCSSFKWIGFIFYWCWIIFM